MDRGGIFPQGVALRYCSKAFSLNRQRILEKLDVDNSMEAVKYASALGLLS
jgi:DNA-binding NarL/FixJ family response regulator